MTKDKGQKTQIVIAQITDTHLFADRDRELYGVTTAKSLQAVLELLPHLPSQPDLILLTGDLSQDMTPRSYQNLWEFLQPLGIPTYWLPGNHDDPAMMQKILDGKLISPQKSFALGNWHFLLLNSTIPEREEGYFSQETLSELEHQLQQNGDKFGVVAFHHPPIAINPKWEESRVQNPDELFDILDRNPQVKVVLFGHIHQAFEYRRGETYYLGTPSTCKQFDDPSTDGGQPEPGLRLLELNPDGTWTTQVERVARSI